MNKMKQTTCSATSPEMLKSGAPYWPPFWPVMEASLAGNQQVSQFSSICCGFQPASWTPRTCLRDCGDGTRISGRQDFPGAPVFQTALPTQAVRALSLVGELRSHMLSGVANKIRISGYQIVLCGSLEVPLTSLVCI